MSNEIDKFLNRNVDKVAEWTRKLIDMIDRPDLYGYADDTLRSILAHMEDNGDITDGQMRAVENIRRKPSSKYGRRRY